MKLNTIFVLFCLQTGMIPLDQAQAAPVGLAACHRERQSFDKSAYYAIMATGDLDAVNGELTLLAESSSPSKEAYEGALRMRLAGLLTFPAAKLRSFKTGRIQLESALSKDSANGEYHFLRLIIQEHAPGIVRYSKDLDKDGRIIRRTFANLAPAVQKAVLDYSKRSKTLHPEDLDPKKN